MNGLNIINYIKSERVVKYNKDIKEGNILLLIGSRDKKQGSFLIKSVSAIKNLV